MTKKSDWLPDLEDGGAFDITVRRGVRGYTGYFGPKGRLHSTRIIRSSAGRAKEDALSSLIWHEAVKLAN